MNFFVACDRLAFDLSSAGVSPAVEVASRRLTWKGVPISASLATELLSNLGREQEVSSRFTKSREAAQE
jgi:hypothetical protein